MALLLTDEIPVSILHNNLTMRLRIVNIEYIKILFNLSIDRRVLMYNYNTIEASLQNRELESAGFNIDIRIMTQNEKSLELLHPLRDIIIIKSGPMYIHVRCERR